MENSLPDLVPTSGTAVAWLDTVASWQQQVESAFRREQTVVPILRGDWQRPVGRPGRELWRDPLR